jgi:DNA-binding transcriptional ArsR family regulator
MANVDRVLDALGDPTRRIVFQRLRAGARSVTDISRGMAVSRPAVSQHLKVLKEARLVTDHAEGTRRVYAVDSRGVEVLRAWLDAFWDTTLAAFKEAAELDAKRHATRNARKGARR